MKNVIVFSVLISTILLYGSSSVNGATNASVYKALFNEAKTKYAAGNLVGAVSAIEKALEADPENKKGEKFLLNLLVELGTECAHKEDWNNAILYLEKAKKMVPEDKDVSEMYMLVRELKDNAEGMYETETGMPDVEQIAQRGNYRAAFEKMQKLGADKSQDVEVRDLYKKLKMVSMTIPEIRGTDEKSELLKKGIGYYLSEEPKGAVNLLQYYTEKNPEDRESASLMRSVKSEYPDVAKEESIADGMSFVESKLYKALNFMYENKFDLAINECNAVIDIEPDNLTALLRLGSAYYSLGMKSRAKESWTKAREIDPSIDEGLLDFEEEKKITIKAEKKESKFESEDQKNFENSIGYYQKMEKQLNLKGRIELLQKIVIKYKATEVDISRIESMLKDLLGETPKKR